MGIRVMIFFYKYFLKYFKYFIKKGKNPEWDKK